MNLSYDAAQWKRTLVDLRDDIQISEIQVRMGASAECAADALVLLRVLLWSAEMAEAYFVPEEVWRAAVGPLPSIPM
jgi:hypothetical protein